MMKVILILTCFLINVFSQNIYSQTNTDSLKLLIPKYGKEKLPEILNQIASELLQTNPDSAFLYAQRANNLSKEINNESELAHSFRLMGRSYSFIKKYDSAQIFFDKAINLYTGLNDKQNIALTLKNYGRLFENKYDFKQALEYYQSALNIFEELKLQAEIAGIYQDIGYVYIYSQKYKLALDYYLKALAIFEKINDLYSLSVIYNNIGITYDSMKDIDKALEYYNKSVKINQDLSNDIVAAYIIHNIGIIYFNKNELDTARQYFDKSLQITEKYDDYTGIAYNLTRIASILKKQSKFDSAIIYLNKSLTHTLMIGDKTAISENYLEYANIYEKKQDFEKAFEYYKKYDQLKDTIFNDDMMKQMNELETKYQTEKKETENKLLKEQSRKRELFSYFLSVVIILFLTLAVVFLLGKRKQQKANRLLEIKNTEINLQKEEIQAQRDSLELINQEILQKNEEISMQRNELERVNKFIEQQNEHIRGSIRYAQTIQNAILPSIAEIEKKYRSFIIFKPKDIVSGDFYWFHTSDNHDFVVVADCTGHGVPGAFMSMIGTRLLSEIIAEMKILEPKDILEKLDVQLMKALKKDISDVQDGMELILCRIKKSDNSYEVCFAGAKRPLVFSKNNTLYKIKTDRRAIGSHKKIISNNPFTNQTIHLSKNDIMYLFSDGLVDQNNNQRIRFGTDRLILILDKIKSEKLSKQQEIIMDQLNEWQKEEPQRDDISFLALQFSD